MKTVRLFVLLLVVAGLAGCGGGSGSGTVVSGNTSQQIATTTTTTATTSTTPTPSAAGSDTGGAVTAPSTTETGSIASTGGTAHLAWDAPVDATGAPLRDLEGYRIYYGTTQGGGYPNVVEAGKGTNYILRGLAPGTYYFVVTDYNSASIESDPSNEASITIK